MQSPSRAEQLQYSQAVNTTEIPWLRVDSEFRAEIEAVLTDGESLSQLVEASLRATVERRRIEAEFIARGLKSRDDAKVSGDYIDADVVLAGLQRKLDAARESLKDRSI